MTMLIEVAAIEPPKGEKKPATIKTVTGRAFDAWPEMLAKLSVGVRYRVEVTARESKGRTYYKIVKAQPANSATPAGTAVVTTQGGEAHRPPAGEDGEGGFLRATLAAFVAAGGVRLDEGEIAAAIATLRRAWRRAGAGAAAQQANGATH
jgi:hypothetical protein